MDYGGRPPSSEIPQKLLQKQFFLLQKITDRRGPLPYAEKIQKESVTTHKCLGNVNQNVSLFSYFVIFLSVMMLDLIIFIVYHK